MSNGRALGPPEAKALAEGRHGWTALETAFAWLNATLTEQHQLPIRVHVLKCFQKQKDPSTFGMVDPEADGPGLKEDAGFDMTPGVAVMVWDGPGIGAGIADTGGAGAGTGKGAEQQQTNS